MFAPRPNGTQFENDRFVVSAGYTPATAQETEASLAMALRWSQAEVARYGA